MSDTPHILGPLYAQATGPIDAAPMVFVHPNPMDHSCWLFQTAHFSSWYRCVAIDLPGHGRSPRCTAGLDMVEVAQACWAAVDRLVSTPSQAAVLVGCSVGGNVIQHMYHLRPAAVHSLVISGTGWRRSKSFAPLHIGRYQQHGIGYRHDYTLADFSPAFATTPLAQWFATLFTERNGTADVDSIITMLEALGRPDPLWLQAGLMAPVLILSGSEDNAHEAAFALRDRLPDARLTTIAGAGHACHMERPWSFDAAMIEFLVAHGHRDASRSVTPRHGDLQSDRSTSVGGSIDV